MDLDAFDFDLPPERIALRPVRPRDAARLLLVSGAGMEDRGVRDLPAILRPGDLLVANDSRVIPAALTGVRASRGEGSPDVEVEANLNRRLGPDRWSAFLRPGRRVRPGDRIQFRELSAVMDAAREGGEVELVFDRAGDDLDAALRTAGVMPLPPYIAARRAPDAEDAADYQTVYADEEGSVAAPTAGLHFTPGLLEQIAARGVGWSTVTLHVNAGTFLPVKADRLEDHRMHAETFDVPRATVAAVHRTRAAGGRVIAVGTTALRALESAGASGVLAPYRGDTEIFLRPGSRFNVVDGLMTNFHLPRSTLFVLVCALMGTERMQRAYAHAVAAGYRFYSYGDSSLLLPGT